jgi:hypothetical protein
VRNLAFVVPFLTLAAFGQVPERGIESLHIPRVSRPPKLSDFLNNVPREAELAISDFRQFIPGDGNPVSQPTTAYLSYDDKHLYIVFICKDDPKLIRARLAKHDLIMADDRFSICIDTFHDHRHMYWFDINPYGVQAEGNVIDGVEDDPSWDTLWHSEARITEDGYAGIAAIPFKSIRFPTNADQTWGLIIGRWIMRNNEYSLWPEVSRRRTGFVSQGGDMDGIRNISPGRNIQLIPYGLFGRSRYLDSPPAMRTETEARAGLDAKIVLKDALTVDVALNPDFSQVESDEPQVTVNQRFEVWFPEKRPFFLENAGYFKTPERLFFSRRIADPRLGARLTGRVGRWSIGALFADDRAPGERVPQDDPLNGENAAVGVVRIQRDLFKDSNVAAMATSSDFGPAHNRVFSFDARLHLLRNWVLTGQAMTSDTRLADGEQLAGPGYRLDWAHSGKHFISETIYTDRSPNFYADLGYFQRVNIRQLENTTGYKWRPEQAIQSIGPKVMTMVNYDHRGRLQDWSVDPQIEIDMTRLTKIEVGHSEVYEYFEGQGFRRHLNYVEFESEPKRWLALNAQIGAGAAINYKPGPALRPFLGRSRGVKAGFTLRPNAHARFDETYIYSTLTTPSASVFNNHIIRSKVNYHFSREASVRFIADYNAVLPNATLTTVERSKHLGIDALFTYMVNPGTALHVGYTDLYDNWRLDPTISPALVRTRWPDLNTGRQFFVKLSYLFRF